MGEASATKTIDTQRRHKVGPRGDMREPRQKHICFSQLGSGKDDINLFKENENSRR